MGQRESLGSIGGTHVFVGLSSIIGFTFMPGQIAAAVKFSSGGSLEIGGASLTWNGGYLMTLAEVINMDSSCSAFFAATGSTARIDILLGFSQGYADT